MPPLDFPNTPALNQTYTGPNGVIWVYDGAKWANGSTIATAYAPLASPVFTGDPQAPTPPAGDADTSLATTAFVAAATATALHDVGRNTLHNSMFTIAQRGTGPFSASNYTLDRWWVDIALDTSNVTQGPFSDTQRSQIGDEAAEQALIVGVTGNAGAAALTAVSQPIEGVRRLAGKTVTASFWAYATAGTPKVGVGIIQSFGTGGSPSANVTVNATAVTLSTTATRYSVTLALPSVAGKTLGTNGNHYTRLMLWLSSGANNNTSAGGIGVQSATFVFWGVQLEVGSQATPLEKLDPVTQLQQCQRFYQTGPFVTYGYSGAAIGIEVVIPLSTPMRASPTCTTAGMGYTNASGGSFVGNYGTQAIKLIGSVTGAGSYRAEGTFTASADL
jgi:hypothetical protein